MTSWHPPCRQILEIIRIAVWPVLISNPGCCMLPTRLSACTSAVTGDLKPSSIHGPASGRFCVSAAWNIFRMMFFGTFPWLQGRGWTYLAKRSAWTGRLIRVQLCQWHRIGAHPSASAFRRSFPLKHGCQHGHDQDLNEPSWWKNYDLANDMLLITWFPTFRTDVTLHCAYIHVCTALTTTDLPINNPYAAHDLQKRRKKFISALCLITSSWIQ